jgi:hypothetical protein
LSRIRFALTLGLAAGLTLLAVTSCGTADVAPPTPTPSAPASAASPSATPPGASPSANPLATALSATNARGTAQLAISVLTTVAGFDDEIDGVGSASFSDGQSDIIWSSVVGQTRELMTTDGLFVLLDPPDGEWLAIQQDEWTPTATSGNPLRGLGDITGLTDEGADVIDGVAATRFTASLPASEHGDGMGLNEQALRLVTDDPTAAIDLTVWVDGQGLITRIMRTLRTSADVAASTVTNLAGFGTSVQIITPELTNE